MWQWALMAAIPAAGLLSFLWARRAPTIGRALLVTTIVSLVLATLPALIFGRAVRLSGEDPVVGLVLYVMCPLVGLTSAIACGFGLVEPPDGAPGEATRRRRLVMLLGIPLALLTTVAGIAAFVVGLQIR